MPEATLHRLDAGEAQAVLDQLADLYLEVYAEPPYNSAPKFSRERFLARTQVQISSAGFVLTTAEAGGTLTGFAFGFSMPPGSWWANASHPTAEITEAPKFAVIELIVAPRQRGRGLGRSLLGSLLENRPEHYATLAAVIDADAYSWYLRAGWTKVAEFRSEPPFSDALVLDLTRPRPVGG